MAMTCAAAVVLAHHAWCIVAVTREREMTWVEASAVSERCLCGASGVWRLGGLAAVSVSSLRHN